MHPPRHRGTHPSDDKLFGERYLQRLEDAAQDLNYLLDRQYGEASASKIVTHRYRLNERQRMALRRVCAAKQDIEKRAATEVPFEELKDKVLWIDGFNLLILMETALGGGLILKGYDTCYRDMSGVYGTYKRVEETQDAIDAIARVLHDTAAAEVNWLLDAPISNSGRLKQLLRDYAEEHDYNWSVETVRNPDRELAAAEGIVVTSDTWILDRAEAWTNLPEVLLEDEVKEANLLVL